MAIQEDIDDIFLIRGEFFGVRYWVILRFGNERLKYGRYNESHLRR
jgi:hypothetical protein